MFKCCCSFTKGTKLNGMVLFFPFHCQNLIILSLGFVYIGITGWRVAIKEGWGMCQEMKEKGRKPRKRSGISRETFSF